MSKYILIVVVLLSIIGCTSTLKVKHDIIIDQAKKCCASRGGVEVAAVSQNEFLIKCNSGFKLTGKYSMEAPTIFCGKGDSDE